MRLKAKPLINFASNVFNMIFQCKIRCYKNSKVFEAAGIIFTLWSKIDTVRAILLSNLLLLPTSIHLVFSRFKVSLWSFSHFATPNKCDLAYHWAPGKMSLNSKSRCRLHIGTHSSIPECLADKDYKKMNIFYCLFVFYLFIYLFDILLMPGFIIHLLAFLDIDWC